MQKVAIEPMPSWELTVLELLAEHGITPRLVSAAGREYHSACPGCGGRDRFIVWAGENHGTGRYRCRPEGRGCGKRGDNIQFVIDFEGLPFREAAKRVGRGVPETHPSPSSPTGALRPPSLKAAYNWQPKSYGRPNDKWLRKASEFAARAHGRLLADGKTLDWLAARGISRKLATEYLLGVNPGEDGRDLYRARTAWGLPDAVMNGSGSSTKKPLWLPRGLVIPYLADGEVVRLKIRRPQELQAFLPDLKYYVVPGSSQATMLLGKERRAHVVVEAELDAIACMGAGVAAVGAVTLGSVSTRPDSRTAAVLRQDLIILNALDYEENRAGRTAADWWLQNFPNNVRWPVPEGKDPGEAFGLGVDLGLWLEEGLPPVLRI